ncbi:von Willebrand factor A domain-containing protein 3B-like [Dendronephthya gigantea]|uniref:von Willebrand factor A domain-containing protein 3B-like n=1 Tax=Dendronephthya gigantea TaxID=151771 RepID=UPI0010696BD9|nr:von Willebrand factor A domain-containing protein 3B-like [Dendronephthya gigantea]
MPKLRNANSPSLSPLKQGTWKQYDSSRGNPKQWPPDVNMLLSTSRWLELFGLQKYKLELKQILSSIGFKHSEEYVKSLQKPVTASYSRGMFPQYACEDGTKYNLLGSLEKLKELETQLQRVIEFYKERLEWLTTSSRLMFGVIQEQFVTVVLDLHCSTEAELDLVKYALFSLVKEQLMYVTRFNFIGCSKYPIKWQRRSVDVSQESIEEVLDWIYELPFDRAHDEICTIEALVEATEDEVESIYLCTDGTCLGNGNDKLRRKIEDLLIPIHIIAMKCNSPSTLHLLREALRPNEGRFHKFSFSNNDYSNGTSMRTYVDCEIGSLSTLSIVDRSKMQAKLEVGKCQDVIELREELSKARENVAEVKAIQLYITQQKLAVREPSPEMKESNASPKEKTGSELYMGSKEWLTKHSLHAKKIGFYDVLQNIAFRHCDGVIDVPNHLSDDGTMPIVKSKLVDAKYCEQFAHVRWKDGDVRHVHISGEVHRNYERRVTAALESFKKRIQWLRKGSRELFGTIIEDKITILIDTSASMNSRLFLVKDKLYQLLQEQIKHKQKFNLIKYDSQAMAWRSRLVDCTDRNINDAWQWIKGLTVGGSTNTLAALKLALSDELCEAIYLLTDGRPDQPASTILAQIHLRDPIPIHTISFNCSDGTANEFLCKLSEMTNARFHYFSENGSVGGESVKVYESEDVRLIREEMEQGTRDLERLTRLRDWCAKLDWVSSNVSKTKSNTLATVTSKDPSRVSKPRVVRKKKSAKAETSTKVEDKKLLNEDNLLSSDNESTVKSELSVNDEEQSLVEKSTKEGDGDVKKSPQPDKIKRKKTAKRKIVPHSCDLGLTTVSNISANRRKVSSPTVKPSKPTEQPKSQWIRNHKVLARNNVDGFYYPGALRVNINPRYADVSFRDIENQVVSLRHIIPNEGSRPCPSLKVGDFVLVTLTRSGRPLCYVPGVVYVVPLRQSKATKFYTIIHYNGSKATALRKDVVKISQSRYAFACRYIKDCEITANKSPAIAVFNKNVSKSSSSSSDDEKKAIKIPNSKKSGSESSDDDKSTKDNHVDGNKSDNKRKGKNDSDDDSDSSLDDKKASPRTSNDELERIKKKLLETRESQEEQQKRFEELQQQVKDAMLEQNKRQEELKRQYEEMLEGNGDGGKSMNDKELEEAKKMLDEKQEDIINDFKKHKELLEQLLQQQKANSEEDDSEKHSGNDKSKGKKKKWRKKRSSEGHSSSSESDKSDSSDDDSPKQNMPEQEHDDKTPSKIHFHVKSGNKEACLWTKGSHGLLISRAPLDEDPAVENRPVPAPLQNGEEVLARWSDDGWYYTGTVRETAGENYLVEDSVGNMEEISRENIISDEDDAANSITTNDAVIALHPNFSFSYAPGVVVNVNNDMLFSVRFYDGREDVIPREEVYYLSHEKFSAAVEFIVHCEERLVGMAVVARNDTDGLFYLGHVRDRVGNGRQYVVQWPEGDTQVQSSSLIFGAHTKRHQLAIGDKVLALSDKAQGIYEPGLITGVKGKKLSVKFNRRKKASQVDPLQCFWLSSDYYDRTVEYIAQLNAFSKGARR